MILAALLLVTQVATQDPRLERLDPDTRSAVVATLDSARDVGLPVESIIQRALEGATRARRGLELWRPSGGSPSISVRRVERSVPARRHRSSRLPWRRCAPARHRKSSRISATCAAHPSPLRFRYSPTWLRAACPLPAPRPRSWLWHPKRATPIWSNSDAP